MQRRDLLKGVGAITSLSLFPALSRAAAVNHSAASFVYCLNIATIRGHQLGFIKELEVAARAGFSAVEIWMDSLQTYLKSGGTAKEAKKRLNDLGLDAADAIGFANWIVDDETKRKAALEQMAREMDLLAQLGCKRIAAPPSGATTGALLDLKVVAERYRAILDLGDKTGVIPQLEMWGFSKNLSRVSEVMYVALESGHASAKVLLDVFHLYKGGSSIDSLRLVSKSAIDVLHVNDYAADQSAEKITDADRIYPGDGIAPIGQILKTLSGPDKPLIISNEVFNKQYYSQDALAVAKTALMK